MSKAISLTGLSEFLKKCKEIFVEKGSGGNEPLVINGTCSNTGDGLIFEPDVDQPSFEDAVKAFLSGRIVTLTALQDTEQIAVKVAGYYSEDAGYGTHLSSVVAYAFDDEGMITFGSYLVVWKAPDLSNVSTDISKPTGSITRP